jgi:hypothetical protein
MSDDRSMAEAKERVNSLKAMTKKEVGAIYASRCLPRVHDLNLAEQRKAWMIYDIIAAEYGQAAADAVA